MQCPTQCYTSVVQILCFNMTDYYVSLEVCQLWIRGSAMRNRWLPTTVCKWNTFRSSPALESVWSVKCDLGHPSKCGNVVTMCNDLSSSNHGSPAIVWLIPQHRRVISKIYIKLQNVNKTGAFGGRNRIFIKVTKWWIRRTYFCEGILNKVSIELSWVIIIVQQVRAFINQTLAVTRATGGHGQQCTGRDVFIGGRWWGQLFLPSDHPLLVSPAAENQYGADCCLRKSGQQTRKRPVQSKTGQAIKDWKKERKEGTENGGEDRKKRTKFKSRL